ncbi:MAG: hypothetical protein D3921_02555 [Candidatus Electrothrix sp. AW1]|nr:hypothetical protein [Candidatus Electrothrix sp. AX1]MCI5181408.1 hypothetical protein [Candidatus Electrothrix gigas]
MTSNCKQCFLFFIFLIVLPVVLSACNAPLDSEERAQRTRNSQGDIFIALVQTSVPSNFFFEGAQMAIEEINQQGGLLGRKLVSVPYDDKGDPVEAEKIARKISKNKDIIAVIGHRLSSAALPASIIYEQAGILFISYGATNPSLTEYSTHYTFRNIPTNNDYGLAMAKFMHNKGFKKIMVFHERETTQINLADIFKKEAVAKGIEIAATRSYFQDDRNFKEFVSSLKQKKGVDSVALFGLMPAVAYLLKEMDEMGINLPIVGSDGMDYPDLFTIAGNSAEGVSIPTVFDPLYPDKKTRTFVKKFQKKFNITPDKWAAQGYDAVSLFAHIVQKTGKTTPATLASHLRFLENWHGVTGVYSFTPQGDIKEKDIFFKKVQQGKFFFDVEQVGISSFFSYIEDLTLRLPLKEPVTTLDPALVRNKGDVEIAEQLFLGLTGLDPTTNKPIQELATKWERELNDTRYHFTLREDINWTDGTPVTANDVLWAIQRNLDPKTASPQVEELFILKNAQDIYLGKKKKSQLKVYAVNDFSLIFDLEHPDPFFPARVSLPVFRPLPKLIITQYKDDWTDPDTIQTNGPYRPIEWQKNLGIFLKKNQQYFAADKVSIPEVRYFVVAQPAVGLAMYKNNELDVMGGAYLSLPLAAIPGIKQGPLYNQYNEVPTACTYTYLFDTKRVPVNQPLVRKAISAAIDRQLLIDAVHAGVGEPATSCTPPALLNIPQDNAHDDADDAEVKITFNPEQAKKWLVKAGYPNGEGFPELTLVTKNSEDDKKIADGIKTMLKHFLHISVKIKTNNRKEDKTVTDQEFAHITLFKACSDYPTPDNILKKIQKKTNWTSNTFNRLIRSTRYFTKTQQQQKAYKTAYRQADKILCQDEVAVLPIFHQISPVLIKPKVQGWEQATIGGQQLEQCSFKKYSY